MSLTGFILKLENLENRAFLRKIGENWNSQGIFYNFYPSQGKVMESKLFSPHIIFINSLCLFAKWLFHLALVNAYFITLHSALASICTSPIYQAPFSVPTFVNR